MFKISSLDAIRKGLIILTAFVLIPLASNAAVYFVSQNGDDLDDGSIGSPLKTIQKAAEIMAAGDVCYIRAGIYRETVKPKNSGTPGSPITFLPYNGENVTITGTDRITAWQVHDSNIYKASVKSKVTDVFADWKLMNIARFPNNLSDNMLNPTLGTADNGLGTTYPGLSYIQDDILSGGDWKGASLFLLGGRAWVAWDVPIEDQQGSKISFKWSGGNEDAYKPQAGNKYFISGSLKALDTEKEWFYDTSSHTLYFYSPGGINPSSMPVDVRVRQFGFDLSDKAYIKMSGITFFGANISFDNANNCELKDSKVVYVASYFPADGFNRDGKLTIGSSGLGVALGGTSNKIVNCEVAHSWGDGISIYGDGNTIENCLIHDVDWSATDSAPITTAGRNHIIRHNTLRDTARSALVHRKTASIKIEYNDIFNYGVMTTDLGATYCYETEGEGSVLAYNWVHDPKNLCSGIYLDNNSSDFIVHHNVVWNCLIGIQTNKDGINHQIYNNTLWKCSNAMLAWGPDGTYIKNQKTYNNLSDKSDFIGNDFQKNRTISDGKFVDSANGNFMLTAESSAVDYGIVIPGFTDGYSGAAPDAGAYEYGGIAWTAGTDIKESPIPVPVEVFTPSLVLQAESFDEKSGVDISGSYVSGCGNGDWLMFRNIDFGDGYTKMKFRYASTDSGLTLKIKSSDLLTGTLLGELTLKNTGGNDVFAEDSLTVQGASGVMNVYFVFEGDTSTCVADKFRFEGFLGGGNVPAAPTGLIVKSSGKDDVLISWDDVDNETGYRIERKSGDGSFLYIGNCARNQTTFYDSHLIAASIYYYRVTAFNYYGESDYSGELQITTPSGMKVGVLLEAENYSDMYGIIHGDTGIGGCDNGEWVKFGNVNLGSGYSTIRIRVGEPVEYAGSKVEIRSGDPNTGKLLGTLIVAETGGWGVFNEQVTTLTGATGVMDVYFVFRGGYGVGNFDWFNFEDLITSVEETDMPSSFALKQNFPNPFNPETTIGYRISADSDVSLEIYDTLGQKVRTLVQEHKSPGNYNIIWNAKNESGQIVSSGIYFFTLKAKSASGMFFDKRKMLLIR